MKEPMSDSASASPSSSVSGPALTDLIDRAVLQDLQDRMAELTGVAVSIRDPAGRPITETSGESEFCRLLSRHEASAPACRESHAGAAASAPSAATTQHQCHAGLAQCSAPIVADGAALGAIFVGDRPLSPLPEDAVRQLARRHGLEEERLVRAAWGAKHWSARGMRSATRLAESLAHALARICRQELELRRRIDELSALYRVSQMLSGERDLKEVLNLSAALVADVLKVKAAAIRLIDETTGELKIAAVHNLSEAYLAKGPLRAQHSRIDAEAMRGQDVYVEDLPSDPRTVYKEEARAEGIVSALVTSLTYRGRSIGVMRAYADRRRRFSDFEVSLLRTVAGQAAAAIIYARMRREAREAEALERQVRLAGEVQRRMIPAAPAPRPWLDVGCIYEPSAELGGDFYDFIEFPDGGLGVPIADVAGKGVPASLTMASVRAALRAHARGIYDLDVIMTELNRHIYRDAQLREFVTCFYGVLDARSRRFTFCNAGHEPVVLMRGGRLQPLETGGLVLGVDERAVYEKGIVDLRAGDTLVFLTDGVIEAINYAGESYGRERFYESIRRHGALDARQMANQLLWDVRRFVGLARQSDDLTIVVLKVR